MESTNGPLESMLRDPNYEPKIGEVIALWDGFLGSKKKYQMTTVGLIVVV